jgi:hypothetical protein
MIKPHSVVDPGGGVVELVNWRIISLRSRHGSVCFGHTGLV